MPAKDIFHNTVRIETFFKLGLVQLAIETQQIKLIVYNPVQEEIDQWIR
jgi:hypothetical protein